jgi:hypothetical protein
MDLTPAEQEARSNRLATIEQEGAIMRDFCRHAGYSILKRMVQEKIDDKRNAWLKATNKDEAEALRLQTQPWNEVMELISKTILKGDSANLARRQEQI